MNYDNDDPIATLRRLLAAAEAANPAPWRVERDDDCVFIYDANGDGVEPDDNEPFLLVALRNAAPALLDIRVAHDGHERVDYVPAEEFARVQVGEWRGPHAPKEGDE